MIAQAIVNAARDRGLPLSMPSDVVEQPGAGLTGIVDSRRVAVGSYAFVCASAAPADWSHRFLQRMGYDGATGVFVAVDGVMAGALLLLTRSAWRRRGPFGSCAKRGLSALSW